MPSVRDSNGREIRTSGGGSVYSGSGSDSDRSNDRFSNSKYFTEQSQHKPKVRNYHNLEKKEMYILQNLERKEKDILQNLERKEKDILNSLKEKMIQYENTISNLNQVVKEISQYGSFNLKFAQNAEQANLNREIDQITKEINDWGKNNLNDKQRAIIDRLEKEEKAEKFYKEHPTRLDTIKIVKDFNSNALTKATNKPTEYSKIEDLEDLEITILDSLERKEKAISDNLDKIETYRDQTPLINKLQNIAEKQFINYAKEKFKDTAKDGMKDIAFDTAKIITTPVPPLNMAVRGAEKISNIYDKVDKSTEIKFLDSMFQDIKQIDLNEHKEYETGYEFVKNLQNPISEEELKAFHDKVDLCADTIQEGY